MESTAAWMVARAVNGDFTKLPYVKTLGPVEQRMLQNLRHTARQISGTQETRALMRFDTHAMRIR